MSKSVSDRFPWVSKFADHTVYKRLLLAKRHKPVQDISVGDYVYLPDLHGQPFYKVKELDVALSPILLHGVLYCYYTTEWWKNLLEKGFYVVTADQFSACI